MEKELLLYSGGPDSTVLLKYFLQNKKNLLVLHIQMGWSLEFQHRIKFTKERVDQLVKYLKNTYGEFEFMDAGIFLNLPYNQDLQFGADDQWCAFIAALVCKMHNIKKIWHASFSYGWKNRQDFNKEPPIWLLHENMINYLRAAYLGDPGLLKFLLPKTFYEGKEIDSFKTKKEAWDSLEPELKKLVVSCENGINFCGKCYKCLTYIKQKMKNEKGEIL